MDNSIRTLFSLLFLFSLGSTSADSGVTLEKCATLSSMAGQIMTYRQNGSTMASVYTLNAQPENKENIKYKVPISFALVDKNHLSVPIDISDLNLLLLKWVSSFFRLIKKKMKVIKVNVL